MGVVQKVVQNRRIDVGESVLPNLSLFFRYIEETSHNFSCHALPLLITMHVAVRRTNIGMTEHCLNIFCIEAFSATKQGGIAMPKAMDSKAGWQTYGL